MFTALLRLAFVVLIVVPALAQDQRWRPPTGEEAPADLQPLGIALEGFDYPFDVHYLPLNVQGQGLRMAYMDVQPDDGNGETVVLLHGKNFSGAYWEQTARDLAAAGYRVVMPDQIGFGKSSKAPDLQYSFHMLAQNTAALLDALDVEQAHILGHSLGGMLATRFALMYPDRTRSLILANPIGLEDWKRKVPYRTIDDWYQRELNKTFAGIKQYQLESYYDGQWDPAYDRWVEMLAGMTLSPEYPRMARVQARTYDMIFTQPVVYEFDQVKAPTLLIIGQRDRTALGKDMVDAQTRATLGNYPQLGRRTAEAIPNATLVEIEGVGHLPHIEAYPRFIEPLKAFLAER